MLSREIIIGVTTHIPATFLDQSGNPIDFTVGTRVAKLRLTAVGSTSPLYTRDTNDANEFTWTSSSTGIGKWIFIPTDVFTAGTYYASVVYSDTDETPDDIHLLGEAMYTIRNPVTGAL